MALRIGSRVQVTKEGSASFGRVGKVTAGPSADGRWTIVLDPVTIRSLGSSLTVIDVLPPVEPPPVQLPPVVPPPVTQPPVTPPTGPVGAVSGWEDLSGGYFGAGDFAEAGRFGTWRGGTRVGCVGDYTAGDWAGIANPWVLSLWKGRGYKVDLATWMFPAGTKPADVLAGRFDSNYRQLGQAAKAFGVPDVTVRLGWEFNGDWFAWGAGRISAADYVACWRHIVGILWSVDRGIQTTWCATAGKLTNAKVEAYYPGDDYVTFIGLDTYDNNGGWMNIRDGVAGLRWHREFAAAHGKPVCFPEWGLVDKANWGQGDDSAYVELMHGWMAASNLAYECYFEFDAPDGKHLLESGQYPNGAAKYKALF
jgi:hypothetical protein